MKVEVIVKIDGVEVSRQETEYEVTEDKKSVGVSEYARFFDETSPHWSRNPEENMFFLRQVEVYCTQKLLTIGHIFLNEVYDMLGLPHTKAGAVVGWVYDKDNLIGDNRIDFGIFTKNNKGFVNGYESSILLDFNVDGNILDRI